jgi:hypothetical protein
MTIEVSQKEFSIMRGHIMDGARIHMDNGETLTLRAQMRGWVLVGEHSISEEMPSAQQVEAYVVNKEK